MFAVEHARARFNLRLNPRRAKLNPFLREQWACAQARPATFHPERLRILRALGRYAARINSTPTRGFGVTFDCTHNQLSSNAEWADYLQDELHLDPRLRVLKRQRMLSTPKLDMIRRILKSAAGKGRGPVLNHGDLRLNLGPP